MSDEIKVKEESTNEESGKIVFKKPKRNIRPRRHSEDQINDEAGNVDNTNALEEIKEKQKLRQRQKGVSIVSLALGKKMALGEEITIKDPYNVKSGGLVNMQSLKSGKLKETDDAYDVGTQFSAETNKRDEDEEMMKYIEQQLQQRKGVNASESAEETDTQKYLTPEEEALFALPDHLRQSTSHRSEEMLSNQMLNGIPEVDLGIEAKIKNIEATEDAKQKLLQDQKNKKDGPSQFVPTNMAVNFMQHNRFNIEDNSEAKRRKRNNGPDNQHPNNQKRATDDFHYDKFKKQFRRY